MNFLNRLFTGSTNRGLPRMALGVALMTGLLVSACQPIVLPAPDTHSNEPRPDQPPYASHGPFSVGYRALVSGDGTSSEGTTRTLDVGLWYPALNPSGAEEKITYTLTLKNPEWRSDEPAIVNGHALLDAPLDTAQGPYPLVIFSPGFSANAAWYSTLVEQVASHGFIVLSPEHIEQDWGESAQGTIDRPQDITQILDYAEALTRPDGDLAGQIDMEHVAVVGHSFGGYTALASAGAQLDLATFNNRCAALASDDQKSFLCLPMQGQESNIAERAGLDSPPEGLWPSLGDPRVTAIIPIAGDAYLFDQAGLANITIPMMAIGGTADTGTPYEWGSKLSYDYVASEQKTLVGFVGAEHMFMSAPCEDMPWTSNFPYAEVMCSDPVWDKQRGLDLIHHFSTAFLLATLKGEEAAHNALLPDAVQFPGIEYSTTLQ